MANLYKVLGQQVPAANTLTTLYTVPAATNTVISTISIANYGASNASYSLSVGRAGAADSANQYFVRGATVPAADSIFLTIGLTLAATDVVRCNTSSATVAFNAFGSEIA
jgi:hypothetical protein